MAADSTSAQRRRVTKPLMEKKRRARINMCLAELKKMVAEKERGNDLIEGRSSRLEKADILEMTVRFLRRNHEHVKQIDSAMDFNPVGNHESPKRGSSFHEGFRSCIAQVDNFLSSCGLLWTKDESLASLMHHLQRSLTNISNPSNAFAPCSSTSFSEPPLSAILPSMDYIQRSPRGSTKILFEDNNFISRFSPDVPGTRGICHYPTSNIQRNETGTVSHENHALQVESQSVWRPWDMSKDGKES